MNETTFVVPNITCGHCVMAIKEELKPMDGVASVEGNPDTKEMTVKWSSPATEEGLRAAMAEINYPAQ